MGKSVLVLATSCSKFSSGDPTGCWAEEIMAPILKFQEEGYDVTVASMQGGDIPIDQNSLSEQMITDDVKKFQGNDSNMKLLKESKKIDDISSGADYDAVYVPGGHGPVFDMVDSPKVHKILAEAYEAEKIVSSVCHGPVVFLKVQLSNGKKLVDGKRVTGFSNTEEEAVDKVKLMPFLLEDELKMASGMYQKGADWSEFIVTDGKLVTGQNPASSKAVADQVIRLLKL